MGNLGMYNGKTIVTYSKTNLIIKERLTSLIFK